MNKKIGLIQGLFIVWTIAIIIRLGYWQIVEANQLRQMAFSQYGSSTLIFPVRGKILSSDNFPLVSNVESYLAYINPQKISVSELDKIVPLLPASDSARNMLKQNSNQRLSWMMLSRGISFDLKKQLETLNISALGFEPEYHRVYPESSASALITGFVGKNDAGEPQGYFGLEGFYQRQLSGKSGKIILEKDALGLPIPIADQNYLPSQNGTDLVTSIDRTVQFYAFQKLEQGIGKYQASGGTVSIMESKTGRILAMVALPGYDPGNYEKYRERGYKNPMISDAYEPGSTFKTIVMASALDSHAVRPDTVCSICSGPVSVADKTIRSWNDKYFPGSTMTDVILHSDNVGMVFVSRQLGKSRFIEYIRRFGFGEITGIDLQEESTPELRPDNSWHEIELATSSFGQGIAVTPIQMLTAVNTIANGGVKIPPRVVTATKNDRQYQNIPIPKSQKVISAAAASQVTQMMVNGVNHGEVRYYKPSGYTIAGKTGTAQVPIEGFYDKNKTIASFIGFAPANDPKFTMLVTLNDPQTSPWGSTTAAPLWFDISRELFRYYKISPGPQP